MLLPWEPDYIEKKETIWASEEINEKKSVFILLDLFERKINIQTSIIWETTDCISLNRLKIKKNFQLIKKLLWYYPGTISKIKSTSHH